MKVTLREVLIPILIVLIIFAGMRFSLKGFWINGPCMEPNFLTGQDWLVNKLPYHFHDPRRGEVIVLHAPNAEGTLLIKRVIGLPGETIEIRDGKVYITKDGEQMVLKESAYVATPSYQMRSVTVPPGEYFVLGDNRNNSGDSHSGWWTSTGVFTQTVPRKNIVGKAWLCYWPPSEWRLCPSYSWELSPSDSATVE